MKNDKVITALNELIQTCRDGQEGFKEAAENVDNQDLRNFFDNESQHRARFVNELQHQVNALGGEPDTAGSPAGALHRAWIEVKGTLTGKDDKAILSEVERGEDSAVKAYETELAKALPENCRPIVERQYRAIKATHDQVRQMRDARSAAAGRRSPE
jgi:uncharacterized protein (TIGR02284 family)